MNMTRVILLAIISYLTYPIFNKLYNTKSNKLVWKMTYIPDYRNKSGPLKQASWNVLDSRYITSRCPWCDHDRRLSSCDECHIQNGYVNKSKVDHVCTGPLGISSVLCLCVDKPIVMGQSMYYVGIFKKAKN